MLWRKPAAATMPMDGLCHMAQGAGGAQSTLPAGVSIKILGEGPAILPGYRRVRLQDIILEPGASVPENAMSQAMVCHITEGEMEIVQNGKPFTAGKGHVWTCDKGTTEGATNAGTTAAIMRVADLYET
jgi:quercetin dioxygenase-like cupin family protein